MFDDSWSGYALLGVVLGLVGVCLRSFTEFRRRNAGQSFLSGREAEPRPHEEVPQSVPGERRNGGELRRRRIEAYRKAKVPAAGHRIRGHWRG